MSRELLEGAGHDITFAVDVHGSVESPVVVWLHSEWGPFNDPPFEPVVTSSVRTLVVHLPGWGESTGAGLVDSVGHFASALWFAVEKLTDGPVILAGHGLGATFAVEMAIQQPRAVAGMVLATPFGMFDESDTGVDIFALLPRDVMAHLYADPTSQLASSHFPATSDGYERGLAAIRRVEVLGAASRFIFPIPDTDVESRAYRLSRVPTTVLLGEKDGVVPPSLATKWQAALPHATVEVVAGVAHMLPYETTRLSQEVVNMVAKVAK